MKHYRQGDVMLVESNQDRKYMQLKKVRAVKGRLIIALGEVTGHHHSVKKSPTTSLLAGPNNEMFLLVKEGEALLEHQEHDTITIPAGSYKVVRQREYTPEKVEKETRVRD